VISPFGIGEGSVRVEDLDDAGFVARSPLGVLGLIDGGRRLAHPFAALPVTRPNRSSASRSIDNFLGGLFLHR
jgi:hypothetical protein